MTETREFLGTSSMMIEIQNREADGWAVRQIVRLKWPVIVVVFERIPEFS